MKLDKLVWRGSWYHKRHNRARYTPLLPRLVSVQPDYKWRSQYRILSGVQRRIDHWFLEHVWEPRRMRALANRYCGLFCTDVRQIDLFSGPIVADIDDPVFGTDLIEWLNHPRVVCVVTTTHLLRSRFIEEGLKVPCYVVPSGVNLDQVDGPKSQELAASYPRTSGVVRLGYAVPIFYVDEELAHLHPVQKLRSISWLLSAMRMLWEERPTIELWLLGQPSKLARRACDTDPRIRLLGYVPHEDVLAYCSLFDIALYPRVVDVQGRHSIKLVEFMACGLPIVSTDVSESFHVTQAGAGLICDSQEAFVSAILRLADDPMLRAQLGENGRRYAQQFGWDSLARRYDTEILQPIIKQLVLQT